MLKIRIIPTMLYKDFGLVKGVNFDSWRRTGSAMQTVKIYNMRQVDELIFLDISATLNNRQPDYELIDDLADECFMPFTVGGGITKVSHIQRLLEVGADKISINTAAVLNPALITEAAKNFGSQCIVVSIDYRINTDGKAIIFTHSGTQPIKLDLITWVKRVEELGAGEIILTSIDRDGTMKGYDINVTKTVCNAVNIPVIASGGAKDYEDMYEILRQTNISAVAAASIFHFTEKTPLEAKKYLHKVGIPTRIPTL